MLKSIRPAIVSYLLLTLITGVIYPAIVTCVAQICFPDKAEGSLIVRDDKVIGSELVAQPFTAAKYFWPRPSACAYDATAGGGSNQSISNPALAESRRDRISAFRAAGVAAVADIPADLLSASGSGLDPHISPESAHFQTARVAAARGLSPEAVDDLINRLTEPPTLGILGEPRVNVLRLNLALDSE